VKNKLKRFKQDMAAAIRVAGVPPQLIYAYERTGLPNSFLCWRRGTRTWRPRKRRNTTPRYFAKNNAK
jgi:hypothetical protein